MQADKLAWAAEIKACALRLQDAARSCPHGHARHARCDRCRKLEILSDLVSELFTVEANQINREYELAPDAEDDTPLAALLKQAIATM
jgi:hypothetical protein